MNPFDLVTSRVDKFKSTGRGRGSGRCPAHKDRRASLSVREFDTGVVGLHCFAGCEVGAVVAALGLQMEDLFPPSAAAQAGRPAERRPYSSRQALDALRHELTVAWVLLADIAAGKEITSDCRRRAGIARTRCMALIDELRLAH